MTSASSMRNAIFYTNDPYQAKGRNWKSRFYTIVNTLFLRNVTAK